MVVGSNPILSYVILGLKTSFMYLKTQKGVFISSKLMPKARKLQKQRVDSEPLWTTVILEISLHLEEPGCAPHPWLNPKYSADPLQAISNL